MEKAPTEEIHRYVVVRGPRQLSETKRRGTIPLPVSAEMRSAILESGKKSARSIELNPYFSANIADIGSLIHSFEKSYIASGDHFQTPFDQAVDALGYSRLEEIDHDLAVAADTFIRLAVEDNYTTATEVATVVKFLYSIRQYMNKKVDTSQYMSADIVIPRELKESLGGEPPDDESYGLDTFLSAARSSIILASIVATIDEQTDTIVALKQHDVKTVEPQQVDEAVSHNLPSNNPNLEDLLPSLKEEQIAIIPRQMLEHAQKIDLFLLRAHLTSEAAKLMEAATSSQSDVDAVTFSDFVMKSSNSYLQFGTELDDLLGGFTASPLLKSAKRVPGQHVKPLGVADLKLVEQRLQKYEMGELAHIENVLAGEKKSREHAVLDRVERSFTFEEEEIKSTEKDLQSTERAELSNEIESIRKEDRKTKFGIDVSAKYGVVSVKTNAGFESSASAEQKARSSRKLTREVIQKASERLSRRVRQERNVTNIFELRETNIHSFEADPARNIVGQYRWVEKHYWSQVRNYGARLMLAFDVPEPAAHYLWAVSGTPSSDGVVRPPEEPNFDASKIDEVNYLALAKRYGAVVSAPPPSHVFRRVDCRSDKDDEDQSYEKITVEDGYECRYIYPSALWASAHADSSISYQVGDKISESTFSSDPNNPAPPAYPMHFSPGIRGAITYRIFLWKVSKNKYMAGLTLSLYRTTEKYEEWKVSVYNAIYQSYQEQLADFERKTARQEAARGGVIAARTDREYRDIEKMELRRGSIELLTDQKFQTFDATKQAAATDRPVFDNADARIEAQTVKFVEGSFEWDQITYEFYPYFWGRSKSWASKLTNTNDDPVFSRFLRSGFARVVVPVERHKERNVLYYLETGKFWDANEPPVLSNPLYLALLAEIDSVEDNPDDKQGVPEGEPWKQVVPTNLVVLDDGSVQLPSWDITVDGANIPFLPSEITCQGKPYNKAQWSDTMFEAASAIRKLGYDVPDMEEAEALEYFRSNPGRRVVRAFQIRSNEIDIPTNTGSTLAVDGRLGPCTLRALTVAVQLLDAEEWPGPV